MLTRPEPVAVRVVGRGVPSSRRMLARWLLLVVALSGCSSVLGTAGEIVDLAEDGGGRVLREPMRPARGTDRVLVIALDGVGEEALARALEDGDLPAFSALTGGARGGGLFEHAVQVPGVVSVFPSVTAAGWAATFTGAPPAVSGVVGNEWFDRDSVATTAPVPLRVDTYEQTVAVWSDGLLNRVLEAPTVFERAGVRSHVSLGFVYRGADWVGLPDPSDVGDVLEGALGTLVSGPDQAFAQVDDDAVAGAARGAERYGLPDLQVVYLPGPDLAAHELGLEGRRAYLREHTDADIEAVLEVYRRRGALEGLTVVVVSDHGQVDVLEDDRHSLGTDGDDEPPALLRALGYRLAGAGLEADSTANLALVYGGGVAALTVANGAACARGARCDWSVAPDLEADVLPLARALQAADRGAYDVGGLEGALDLVLVRASDPSGRTAPPFRVLEDGDPIAVGDFLARHPRPDLVDLERRLGWLTDGPLGHRAGDVLLLAVTGEDRPLAERFYFAEPRRTAHGGASPAQSFVGLLVVRPGASGSDLRREVRAAIGDAPSTLDVTPLLLSLLGATP